MKPITNFDLQLCRELLLIALKKRDDLSITPTVEQWESLFQFCKTQALLGVGFVAVSRLSAAKRPPKRMLGRWFSVATQIVDRNKSLTHECEAIVRDCEEPGVWCCVLKGQGNQVYYPDWLQNYRMSGDIDLWVSVPGKKPIKQIIEYCQSHFRYGKVIYNHIDIHRDNLELEVHFRPSWLNSPIRNKRLQLWFRDSRTRDTVVADLPEGHFPIPTLEFNMVFQLLHIYKHLFLEGIGMRQLMDYGMVMEVFSKQGNKERVLSEFRALGLLRFAAAVGCVLRAMFELSDECLLVPPDEKEGEFLLSEILQAGNFGVYDKRLSHSVSPLLHAWEKLRRNMHLLTHYPEEVLFEPVFRIYHFLWRKFRLWRWE